MTRIEYSSHPRHVQIYLFMSYSLCMPCKLFCLRFLSLSPPPPPPDKECSNYHGATVEQRGDKDINNVLLLNTGKPFNCNGFIRGLNYFSANNQPFNISIWTVYGTNGYLFVDQTTVNANGASVGLTSVTLPREDWLPFAQGNVMGVSFQSSPLLFSEKADSSGEATVWVRWMLEDDNPQHRFVSNGTTFNRAYSVSAALRGKQNSIPTEFFVKFMSNIKPFIQLQMPLISLLLLILRIQL